MELKAKLLTDFQCIRNQTVKLCEPLAIEDFCIQSIEDVSPPKWHLAHTSWFFETFLLIPYLNRYRPFDPLYAYLFNSYYNGVGKFYPRAKRGLLSKPSVETIVDYRNYIDKHISQLIMEIDFVKLNELVKILHLGMNHEQQHQELLLMDIKHNYFQIPAFPVYQKINPLPSTPKVENFELQYCEGGLAWIGNDGEAFCFDVELPRHQKFLTPYLLANRLVTNEEYAEFIDAGGYQNPDWWLVDGWACIQKNEWRAPLYWVENNNTWYVFSLNGLNKMQPNEPVCHVSFYEADAYARWKQHRLMREEEWENSARIKKHTIHNGNFLETNYYHPLSSLTKNGWNEQFFGDVWEWTTSSYSPYPGYKPYSGTVGEYNGKFMSNQHVLRGGSCATPINHIRPSYRNFFQLDKRWVFSGIRLAADV